MHPLRTWILNPNIDQPCLVFWDLDNLCNLKDSLFLQRLSSKFILFFKHCLFIFIFLQLLCPFNFFSFFSIFYLFILISWRLITLLYCSGFCHTLTWISIGYTCIPHPDPPSHLPLHLIPLGLPSAPGLGTCLMHPTITLYAKQKRRHRCIEQTFGLCGRRRGWDVSREQHRNMYII